MDDYIKKGTMDFRKANLALFAGAFSTFANLYMTQPVLPTLSKVFHISPTTASLSLSLTTISLAISMLIVGSLSEAWGRKPIMTFSMIAVAILTLLIAFVPSYHMLLVLRVIQGIVFAGLPAIAMAYLGEEIEPSSLGAAMGLYISGNSIGGLAGRIIMGTVSDYFNWRIGMVTIGIISLLVAIAFYFLLPASKHFKPEKLAFKSLFKSMLMHLKDPALLSLFGIGFLLMGSFVTMYNYIGFQLLEPPYSLSQTIVGWIFLIYLVGTFSSAWMGGLADHHGRYKILLSGIGLMFGGAALSLVGNLFIKVLGIAIFTFGFFGGHAIASGWIGRRATHDKAQASSLYLFFYYAGSSIGGTTGGIFWSNFGWGGVISIILIFLLIAAILAFIIHKITTKQLTQV
ncbi:MFS transporter [Rummeliibacillus sp. NPDC094406]|uniref:MFS transporter n=1 Tax=Rummeliibacillus sp. NPDC094406 TaxID=3364511 RepID=UPI003811C160